jgi:hypothetical protein
MEERGDVEVRRGGAAKYGRQREMPLVCFKDKSAGE